MAVRYVLANEGFKKRRLTRSSFSDRVHMGKAISLLDAEGNISVAEGGAREVGDGVLGRRGHSDHTYYARQSRKAGKHIFPGEYSCLPKTQNGRYCHTMFSQRSGDIFCLIAYLGDCIRANIDAIAHYCQPFSSYSVCN